MVYCQDCGASNDSTSTACRICNHKLARERSLTSCRKCEALLGEGALFCSACGTPVPVLTGAVAGGVGSRPLAMATNGRDGGQTSPARNDRFESSNSADAGDRSVTKGSGPDSETFDTSSLVSEDDLPAWLRQAIEIEETDEAARQQEEEDQAAAARAEEEAQVARDEAAEREREQAARQADEERLAAEAVPHVAGAAMLETGAYPADDKPADDGADAVAETPPKRSRRRGRAKAAKEAKPTKTAKPAKQRVPRTYPWEGHGDKIVLVVSLALIILAILLLVPGLLG